MFNNKMDQEQFMIDFFPKGTIVSVDANELQQLIKKLKETERKLVEAETAIGCMSSALDNLKITNASLRLKQPLTVKLNLLA